MKKKSELSLETLEQLGSAKGISTEVIVDIIKESFKFAYTKKLDEEYGIYKSKVSKKNAPKVKLSDALVRTELDLKKGVVELYHQFKVVPDDEIQDDFIEIGLSDAQKKDPKLQIGDFYEEEIDLSEFSLLDVNNFIANFKQRLSKAEKDALLETYSDKIGQIITGTVEKYNQNSVLVNLGKTSATLFPQDLIGKETYRPGDPIKVYICGIGKDDKKGTLVKISRSNPGFLRKLFENEIHEIYDQSVIIKDVARMAGVRSKVSVYSNDPNIDPSGACIGQNGNRIQAIVSQLGNAPESKEKIDVITYKPNLGLYLEECLKPGIVIGAKIDLENSQAIVVTQNGTSSLAIGARGCNVILTKQLTKLKDIQIIDEAEAIEKNLEYTSIDEFIVEAREEEKKKYREEALKQQKLNENKVSKDNALIKEENLFTKDEFDEDELNEEPITLEETKVTETNVPEEVVETKETPKVEEEVKEEVVVKETPKKVKYEETIVPTEVKTTTTLESLEKSLEEEKEKENKKASFKSKKKKEENKNKEQTSSVKKESSKMSIYTEEELAEFDDELEDEFDDEDYSEYDSDDYYDA